MLFLFPYRSDERKMIVHMKTRRILALFLAVLLTGSLALSAAEGSDRVITINLATATDEELAEAAAQIGAEQKARMKTSIRTDPAEITVLQGATQKVTAVVSDLANGVSAGKFAWSSSNESVATCSNGTVKGIGAGQAVITCSATLSDGTEVSAQVPVTGLVPVKKIAFSSANLEIMAGDTVTPSISFTPDDASDKTVTLTSSNDKIVRVENGQLVGVLAGKASVTAAANDGSGKTAKVNVTVTKKIGRYDGELTFQGLEWGSDSKTAYKKLQDIGFVDPENQRTPWSTHYIHFWPENELLFAYWNGWYELPVAFRDHSKGAAEMDLAPLKKVGGYAPYQSYLEFLNPIGSDGTVDTEKTELCGVYFYFDNKHERGADIFVDLLSKMEAQYGEFTRYLARDLTRRWYKDMYDIIKDSMDGAKVYSYRELGREIYLNDCAICTLRGKNNTGIMLMIDSSENVTLYYGKTNMMDQVKAIQKVLEAVPDNKEDAGI